MQGRERRGEERRGTPPSCLIAGLYYLAELIYYLAELIYYLAELIYYSAELIYYLAKLI